MPSTVLLFLGGLPAAMLVGGIVVHLYGPIQRRLQPVLAALSDRLGLITGSIAAWASGWIVLIILSTLLGKLAYALEARVDHPPHRWALRQYNLSPGLFKHDWNRLNSLLTRMGNTLETRIVVVAAAVILAVVWRHRRFWIPPVVIGGTYLSAWAGQQLLVRAVDRGHPPQPHLRPGQLSGHPQPPLSLGTFPSGGTMRIVCVWGIIAVLLVYTFPRAPRWVGAALAILVGVAAWVEGYSRIYLLKHWLTDVVSGWIVGALLLCLSAVIAEAIITRNGADGPNREMEVGSTVRM